MNPNQTQQNTNNVDMDALHLTHAIALSESADKTGKPNYNATGASGEKGAYQWMPGNFEADAKSAGLDAKDFSPENQDKVAYSQIKAYKDKGYDPGQIASLWNSGSPNNWQDHSGTNTEGVKYDTPAYVQKVKQNYQQLKGGNQQGYNPTPYSNPTSGSNPGQFDLTGGNPQNTTPQQSEGLGGKALDVAKGIGNFLFPIVGDVYHDIKGDSKKTFLQQAGDTALSALPFIPGLGEAGEAARGGEAAIEGGEAIAKTTPGLLSKLSGSAVAKGAVTGYGAGVASSLSQGKGIGASLAPNANNIVGGVLGGVTPIALKGLGKFATKISGLDPQVYTELENMGLKGEPKDAKLYDQYINATKEHAIDLNKKPPLTMAADNLDRAASDIDAKISEAGKAVGEAKKSGGTIPIAQPDVANVGKNFAQQVSDKYGLNLVSDEAGTVKAIPMEGSMRQVIPSDVSRIENVGSQLNQLYSNGENATVKHATDIISNLNDLVDHTKDDVYGHTNDPLEGLLKSTAGDLNTAVRKGSPILADANDKFSGLKDLQKEIKGMAGKDLGRGELLMRRVFSGDKSGDVQDLFGKIKAETGIDLQKHAVLAKHAIETVGSKADKTLLEKALEQGATNEGLTIPGIIKNIAVGTAKNTFANPEKIGRNLVTGKSPTLLKGLLTKGAVEVGSRIAK